MADSPRWVQQYFAEHLGSRMHRELLPGLRSLTTDFTIAVGDLTAYRLRIEGGRIETCEPASEPSDECHVTVGEADFARIVAGERTPQALFVSRRLAIRGDPVPALCAASAMEEFFRRFPHRQVTTVPETP